MIDKTSPVFLEACARHNADPKVIAGIITVESTWNPFAFRYEPEFTWILATRELARAQRFTEISERILQKSSLGLFQLMGGSARAIGFKGYLPELFDPATNLEWGLRYWDRLRGRYPKVEDAIAAYNAGSARKDETGAFMNQRYVDLVLKAMEEGNG